MTFIRSMTPADLRQVTQIEKRIHRAPWEQSIFQHCLWLNYRCRVMVLSQTQSTTIIGYCISRIMKNTYHILNLGIDISHQRSGFARRLLEELIKEASSIVEIKQICLEVRPSNIAALKLYLQYGFKQTDVKEQYYKDEFNSEDALILTLQF